MTQGKFITLEGGEGSGKSTNLPFIQAFLERHGVDVVVTHEPGGTALAERIRELLLFPNLKETIAQDTELLLMFASRAQHLAEVILPAIRAGKWVVCSRFTDSTYAYQGGGRGVSAEKIALLESWLQGDFHPDLTVLFDLPVEVGMARAKGRAVLDRIEQEDVVFFSRVRAAYLERAKKHARYCIIDAALDVAAVQSQLEEKLTHLLTSCIE